MYIEIKNLFIDIIAIIGSIKINCLYKDKISGI